jgi:hypothetical protein
MAAINRSVATLRIMGDDLLPEEITRRIGAFPSFAHRKGEVLKHPTGRVAKFGMWQFEAEVLEPSDFDSQVSSLLDQLTKDMSIWQELGSKFKVDLFCGWFMNEGNEGEGIAPATLLALGSRQISLSLDIYAPDEGINEATAKQ